MSRQKAGDPNRGSDRPGAELTDQLTPVVSGAVAGIGLDLDELDVSSAGRRRRVRVVVDSDRGVGLDEVASAGRAVSAALDDRDDILGGPYTLEVTSPGVDRPLSRPEHWRRARTRLVRIRRVDGTELIGRVGNSDADTVCVLVDRIVCTVPYPQVERATVEVEFRSPPVEELRLLGIDHLDTNDQENNSGVGTDGTGEAEEESR
jgi:ribosome maturation factor RimP